MKEPVRVADRHRYDTLIDARSPAEFAIDRMPGAVNCPVLDDDERRIVGTLYKQQGAFEARRVGGACVAANLARHMREHFAERPANWKPLVYCWRGGLRSAAMVTWMRMVGWDAQQLAGGYKSWRRHVIDTIDTVAPLLDLRVLCGATGSAKTRVLQALAAQGGQIIDLEALAAHRGSLLGALPGRQQPSQTAFETALVAALDALDTSRPIVVEGESARIGRVALPVALVQRMRASPVFEVVATLPARVAYLLHDYADLGQRPQWLAEQLGRLKELHGGATIAAWQQWTQNGEMAPLFEDLVVRHYDPAYARSQSRHFELWDRRVVLATDDLSADGIVQLAQRVAAPQ